MSTSASDWFNSLIVALSETSQLVVHHNTQVAAAVAPVFHAHVGEVQVPFIDTRLIHTLDAQRYSNVLTADTTLYHIFTDHFSGPGRWYGGGSR